MLYCLMDGRARTATELALVGEIRPATASAHLGRLHDERLVRVQAQGKHRYYSLGGPDVADVLEALSVVAGVSATAFEPNTPTHLRAARTCYDHIAGALGVALHDRLVELGWLAPHSKGAYELGSKGEAGFESLGVAVPELRRLRRRFVYGCLDWSERKPHVGGAVGAAMFDVAVRRRWVERERHSRALRITALGRRELASRFDIAG